MLGHRRDAFARFNRWAAIGKAACFQNRCEKWRPLSSSHHAGGPASRRGNLPPPASRNGLGKGLKPFLETRNEELLLGVKEDDRLKAKELQKIRVKDSKREELFNRVESEMRDLKERLNNMRQYITTQMKEAILLGRFDYRTIPHRKIGTSLDVIATVCREVITQLKHITYVLNRREQQVLEKKRQRQFEAMILDLDGDLEELENEVTQAQYEYVLRKSLAHQDARQLFEEEIAEISSVAGKTTKVVTDRIKMKDRHSMSAQMSGKLNGLKTTLVEINQKLQELLEVKEGKVAHKLKTAQQISRRLVLPVTASRPQGEWKFDIGQLAHNAREIELNRCGAELLPELTFAQRWAVSVIARYSWPLRHSGWDMSIQLDYLDLELPPSHMLKYSNPRRRTLLKKIDDINRDIRRWGRRNERLCDLLEELIGSGHSMLCPHPNPRVYHAQAVPVKYFEDFDRGWDLMLQDIRELRHLLQDECENLEAVYPLESMYHRQVMIDQLNGFTNPPQDKSHPLSRRGILTDRQTYLMWRGARVLTEPENLNSNPHNFIVGPSQVSPQHVAEEAKLPLDFSISNTVHPWQSTWLNHRSLYPDGHRVPVDFILGASTFYHAVNDILKQHVIGIDIITVPSSYTRILRMRYILVASISNIYIFDIWSLSSRVPGSGYYNLGQILSSPSILKVGMDVKWLDNAFWSDTQLDLRGFYDLAQHRWPGELQDRPGTSAMLNRLFDNHDFAFKELPANIASPNTQFDIHSIYGLAMRAYVPLQLFHRLNSSKSVKTNHVDVLFDTRSHYNSPKLPLLQSAEIGPVIVDRCSHESVVHPEQRSVSGRSTPIPLWQDWLSASSQRSALKYLRSSGNDKQSKTGGDKALRAITAYYMATSFGESLHVIECSLGLNDPARWISWAVNHYGLRLNTNDRERFANINSDGVTFQDLKETDVPVMTEVRESISQAGHAGRRRSRKREVVKAKVADEQENREPPPKFQLYAPGSTLLRDTHDPKSRTTTATDSRGSKAEAKLNMPNPASKTKSKVSTGIGRKPKSSEPTGSITKHLAPSPQTESQMIQMAAKLNPHEHKTHVKPSSPIAKTVGSKFRRSEKRGMNKIATAQKSNNPEPPIQSTAPLGAKNSPLISQHRIDQHLTRPVGGPPFSRKVNSLPPLRKVGIGPSPKTVHASVKNAARSGTFPVRPVGSTLGA